MSAVFTPKRYKLSIEDYHKLGEAGILDEDSRVELIEGDLIEMAPIGVPHMRCVNRLTRILVNAVGDAAIVSTQNPVTLPPLSEPQPDFALLKPSAEDACRVPHPEDVLLIVEVADTTLAYDRRTKLPLVTLLAGLAGLTFAAFFQFYANVLDWPLNVGGKPDNSALAFIPICFELTVLCGGLATVFALLVRARLYPGRRERLAADRVTDDEFALVLRRPDNFFERRRARELLEELGARFVEEKEGPL